MLQGLNSKEAEKLKQKFGDNLLPVKKQFQAPAIFINQFKSPLIFILIFAAAIPFYFNERMEVILIFSVVVLNVVMGFYQEYSAQKILVSLRKIIEPQALVIRDGETKQILAKDLVPGDIAVLGNGDKIPADGVLVSGTPLLINEAILTGEGEAVEKNWQTKKSQVFMGTIVDSGSAFMKVVNIGPETEIGKIAATLGEIHDNPTPLQLKLDSFAKQLVFIIGIIALIIFLTGAIFYHQNIINMLKIAVILAVAAIPEGLPIAVTVVMARGMKRVLKHKGLVKKMLSIETLGLASVICTDKTGTLTLGQMKVVKSDFGKNEKALLGLTLLNNQRTNLEKAIWDFVKANGYFPQKIFNSHPRIFEESFTSAKKFALMINQINEKNQAFILGAPDVVLNFCQLTSFEKQKIMKKVENWAIDGLKVLSVAHKTQGNLKEKSDFSWLGMIGIKDPIRKEVAESLAEAQGAGIKVKIVTGDFLKTAEAVACQIGLRFSSHQVMEGKDFSRPEEEVKLKIMQSVIFARVTPIQKLKIVETYQMLGEVVAMTGDGVNDAPALKKADIGVVVDNASEVAREAADLILLDGNFKTIVAAIEEGRIVLSNIKKITAYVLSNSFAEIILIFGAMIFNLPAPLTVVQILWLHLICDGPPDITLAFEQKEKGLMAKNPRDLKKEEILNKHAKFLIGGISVSIGIIALLIFWNFWKGTNDLILSQTVAFATLAIVDLIYVFSFKNLNLPIIKTGGLFSNKFLLFGVFYGFVLIFTAIYVPFVSRGLKVMPLRLEHWAIAFFVGISITFFIECSKILFKKNKI